VTRVEPFRALRYDPERVDLARVIVPPYDVISPQDRVAFYELDPYNAIRLTLTRSVEEERTTDYAHVARLLEEWKRKEVLRRDPTPAFYGLRQRFTAPGGGELVREGLLGLLHLEDYARRIVLPHERTLSGPKADRLKLLEASRVNLSSVFLLYEDRSAELWRDLGDGFDARVLVTVEDGVGVEHTLTRIDAARDVERVRAFFDQRSVVIADGHHRYETALRYRDLQRQRTGADDGPHEWMLAYFANAYAPGSLLLPIHRLVRSGTPPSKEEWARRLPDWTQHSVSVDSARAVPALLAEHLEPLRDRHAFAADDASGRLRLFSKPAVAGELTVDVLREQVIGGVLGLDEAAIEGGALEFPKDAVQTAEGVREGRGTLALYLNALSPDDVFRVTAAGGVMPQKSTFFHPKLATGLVFRELGDDA
jgi:uncharacterized protein (DUF1015 family)